MATPCLDDRVDYIALPARPLSQRYKSNKIYVLEFVESRRLSNSY